MARTSRCRPAGAAIATYSAVAGRLARDVQMMDARWRSFAYSVKPGRRLTSDPPRRPKRGGCNVPQKRWSKELGSGHAFRTDPRRRSVGPGVADRGPRCDRGAQPGL